ncbi:MAG: hypothetical protein ACREAU_03575 [Nitrosopumilaceae archaeon]
MKLSEIKDNMLFEMAHLLPRSTGLPYTVWVSGPIPGAKKHAPRIKVQIKNKLTPVTIGAVPKRIQKQGMIFIPDRDFESIKEWIILNKDALLNHFKGNIDSVELAKQLKSI